MANWKKVKLEEVCSVEWGNSELTKASYILDGEYLAVSAAGCDGRIGHREHAKNTPVISAIGANCGRMFLPREDFTAIKNTITITPVDGVSDGRYLYEVLTFTELPKRGGAQPFMSKGDIESFKIDLPPLAEQRKIAEILRTWDEAIEAAEAELKAKQERKRGMMQKLMSPGGQIEAKKTNSFRESVKRFALPGDWRWMFIHDVAKVSFSSVDKKSVEGEKAVRLCNYMDVFYNRRIREGMAFMESTASDSDIKKFTLNEGDVVLTKDSETPEEIAFAAVIAEQIDNLVCGYHLAVLRPDRAKVTGEYLMSAINFQPNHHQFIRLANGATRFGLGIDSLSNAVIPVPPMDVQRNIAEILKSADVEVELIDKRIEFLRAQKRGLMQKLLTGEVRVAA